MPGRCRAQFVKHHETIAAKILISEWPGRLHRLARPENRNASFLRVGSGSGEMRRFEVKDTLRGHFEICIAGAHPSFAWAPVD